MIRFLLKQTPVTITDIAPDTTVLEYLRNHRQLCGSKEGCASGDCGACTVVCAELEGPKDNRRLRYRSLNSCITPLPMLHGKQLLTVEHLAEEEGLHPVQKALVDHHGSQCGFCTPGFVMSLFALWQAQNEYSRIELEQALAGNLCRCTGYQPIIDAGMSLCGKPRDDQFKRAELETIKQLQALQPQPNTTVSLSHEGSVWFAPDSTEGLATLLAQHPDARLIAGSTDLGLEISQGFQDQPLLIYTGAVAELHKIEESNDEIRVGASVSFTELYPVLQDKVPAFAQLLERLGSPPIRNQGTLAGNLASASPIGDTAPILLALDASLQLRSLSGSRIVPISEFFKGYRQTVLAPGEFIEAIFIPLPQADNLSVYKVSKRFDDDISTVLAAICLGCDDKGLIQYARIAFGGMAATPKRALLAEQALHQQPLQQAAIDQAKELLAQEFSPLSDVRGSSAYRMQIAQNLLQRYWLESQPGDPVQVMALVADAEGGIHA